MADEKVAAQVAELTALIDDLIAANAALGAKIDAIRDKRREINREIGKAQAQLALLGVAKNHPSIDAVAPGALVIVSGKELLKAMASSL